MSEEGEIEIEIENGDKKKAHACLMIAAWMILAPVGILMARYFKFIFPSLKVLGADFWFNIHRSFMILVPIISIISFLVILSDLEWKWIETEDQIEFAHSITGIIAISFSVIQVLIGFLRPDKDAPTRTLFNYFHRTLGLSCFILAIATVFIGVFIEDMHLGRIGWGIMIGWVSWIFILPLILEILSFIIPPSNSEYEADMFELISPYFLIAHIVVSLGLSIALIVVIGVAKEGMFPN